jgi:hypothetical protein
VIISVLFVLVNCSQSSNETTSREYSSISGEIVNLDKGKGLPGIDIQILELYNGYRFECTSDKHGNFKFEKVLKGVYQIIDFKIYRSCPKGLVITKIPEKIKVSPGTNIKNIKIYLKKGAEISGYVFAADGVTPLKNIELEIMPGPPTSMNNIAKTDDRGKYVVKGLEGGHKEISNNTPGFETECVSINVKPWKKYKNVNFILGRGNVSVRGKVVSARDNRVITGISISIIYNKLNKYYSSGMAVSDSIGEYSLIGLRYPGTFELSTVDLKEEYEDIERYVELKLGENIIDIKLKPKKIEEQKRKK